MKSWAIAGYLLLIAGTVPGCFRTRDAEPPASNSGTWVAPTDYTVLLNNLQQAVANRNTQNYLRCLNPDSLVYVPAASEANRPVWLTWSLREEQSWFENMVQNLASASGNSLKLTQTELRDVSATSVRYVGDYTFEALHNDTTLTRRFRGQVQLVIRQNVFNEWEIARWEDVETSPDSSWSRLKARFVQ